MFGDEYDNVVGPDSFTVITTLVLLLPPEFVAVITYVIAALGAAGIPEITPVTVLKFNPAESAGEIL